MSNSRQRGRLLLSLIKEGRKEEARKIIKARRDFEFDAFVKERAFLAGYFGETIKGHGLYQPESFAAGVRLAEMSGIKRVDQ